MIWKNISKDSVECGYERYKELFRVRIHADEKGTVVKIQPLTSDFTLVVAELYAQVFREEPWKENWTREGALAVIHNPLLRWQIALSEQGDLIGFVAGCVASTEEICHEFGVPQQVLGKGLVGYKAELGVRPDQRRMGLGRQLTIRLLQDFADQGASQFLVRTRPDTGNYPWYHGRIPSLYCYPDGRELFGCSGLPTL